MDYATAHSILTEMEQTGSTDLSELLGVLKPLRVDIKTITAELSILAKAASNLGYCLNVIFDNSAEYRIDEPGKIR